MSLCLRIPELGLNFDLDEEEADEDDEEDDEEEGLLIISMSPPTNQYGEVARITRLMSSEGLCSFLSL
jgi:hypothetical protein